MRSFKAYAYKLLALILGYSGPTFFKVACETMPTAVVIFYFMLIGGIAMLCLNPQALLAFAKDKSGLCTIKKNITVFLLVSINMAVCYIIYTHALMISTVTETVLIVRIGPLFAIPLSLLILKEKLRSAKLICLAAFFAIAGLFYTTGNHSFAFSNLLSSFALFALLAGITSQTSGVCEVYLAKQTKLPITIVVGILMISSSIYVGIWAWFRGENLIALNASQFFWVLYLGLVTIGLSSYFNVKAVNLAGSYNVIVFIEFFGPIISMIWTEISSLKEGLYKDPRIIVGFLLISVAAVIANYSVEKKGGSS
jgi:drug/metabolite transporter (DMT)-like permease